MVNGYDTSGVCMKLKRKKEKKKNPAVVLSSSSSKDSTGVLLLSLVVCSKEQQRQEDRLWRDPTDRQTSGGRSEEITHNDNRWTRHALSSTVRRPTFLLQAEVGPLPVGEDSQVMLVRRQGALPGPRVHPSH